MANYEGLLGCVLFKFELHAKINLGITQYLINYLKSHIVRQEFIQPYCMNGSASKQTHLILNLNVVFSVFSFVQIRIYTYNWPFSR